MPAFAVGASARGPPAPLPATVQLTPSPRAEGAAPTEEGVRAALATFHANGATQEELSDAIAAFVGGGRLSAQSPGQRLDAALAARAKGLPLNHRELLAAEVERLNLDQLNAFITVTADLARVQAKQAEAQGRREREKPNVEAPRVDLDRAQCARRCNHPCEVRHGRNLDTELQRTERREGLSTKPSAQSDACADPLGEPDGHIAIGVASSDEEFIAPPAENVVRAPTGLAQARGDLPQHLVARGMTEVGVELLELVDVQQEQHQRAALPP
jgi:hypothetical protein